MEKSVQFCQVGLRRDFFITFNVLQAHLLKTLYYCIFDTKRLIRGHMKKYEKRNKGIKKTKELILRAVEKKRRKN